MAIVGALPYNIQNGQLEDATPVMANFNFLQSQVNANAQPSGVIAEWVPSGLTPTFISATQFSVTGNQTAIFTVKRRVLLTVGGINGGATITASVFGAVTTVTVTTDTAGFLTAGLTAVAYSFQDAAILSAPKKSAVTIYNNATGTNLSSNTNYVLGSGAPVAAATPLNDLFSEFNSGTGNFVTAVAGTYLVTAVCRLAVNGATITNPGVLYIQGATNAGQASFSIGTGGTLLTASVSAMMVEPASSGIRVSLNNSPTFTGGPVQTSDWQITVNQVF